MSPTDRLARLAASKTEAAALKAWQADGERGDRPPTPILDEAQATGSIRPPAERKPKGEGRKASPLDQTLLDVLTASSFRLTIPGVAKMMGVPASSTTHAMRRLVAAGKADAEGKPAFYGAVGTTYQARPLKPAKADKATVAPEVVAEAEAQAPVVEVAPQPSTTAPAKATAAKTAAKKSGRTSTAQQVTPLPKARKGGAAA